jgi:hypothetical protein
VVHHYIIGRLEPIFERMFIYDSYSCRAGKGTHFGVSRVNHFIRSCSENYTKDCYVLKIDIQGFFMNIRKEILLHEVLKIVRERYHGFDKPILMDLCTQVILHNPVENCIIKGDRSHWDGLPENKSLFRTGGQVGIPIGNLTSQVFANLYLNSFDHFIKRTLKHNYYGRYVDDCILIHPDKELLKSHISAIKTYLETHLHLTLHPKKIYLQHYTKGVAFVGVFIKPYRQYIGKRTRKKMNRIFRNEYRPIYTTDDRETERNVEHWMAGVNSYLGISRHYDTYRFRQSLIERFANDPVVVFNDDFTTVKRK